MRLFDSISLRRRLSRSLVFLLFLQAVTGVMAASAHSSQATSLPTVSATSADEPSTDVRQQWISAIGNDRIATLHRLLDRQDAEQLIGLSASNGKNALMVASKKGDMALVRQLVAAGSEIDARTVTNGTAFMFAVLGGQQAVARWLLEQGADLHVVGSNGWTALTLAVARGDKALMEWLIAEGAETQVRDVYRFTPFMRAVENGRHAVAERLLTLPETDIDAQDEYGNTALHHAVAAGDEAMVTLLLAHGASLHVRNRDGLAPAALARENPAMQALLP